MAPGISFIPQSLAYSMPVSSIAAPIVTYSQTGQQIAHHGYPYTNLPLSVAAQPYAQYFPAAAAGLQSYPGPIPANYVNLLPRGTGGYQQ